MASTASEKKKPDIVDADNDDDVWGDGGAGGDDGGWGDLVEGPSKVVPRQRLGHAKFCEFLSVISSNVARFGSFLVR